MIVLTEQRKQRHRRYADFVVTESLVMINDQQEPRGNPQTPPAPHLQSPTPDLVNTLVIHCQFSTYLGIGPFIRRFPIFFEYFSLSFFTLHFLFSTFGLSLISLLPS